MASLPCCEAFYAPKAFQASTANALLFLIIKNLARLFITDKMQEEDDAILYILPNRAFSSKKPPSHDSCITLTRC